MIRGDQLLTCKCDRTQANTTVPRNHSGLDDSGSATCERIDMKTQIQSKVHTSSSSGSGNASALIPFDCSQANMSDRRKVRGFKTSAIAMLHARREENRSHCGSLGATIAPQKTRYSVPTMDVKHASECRIRNNSTHAMRSCTVFNNKPPSSMRRHTRHMVSRSK